MRLLTSFTIALFASSCGLLEDDKKVSGSCETEITTVASLSFKYCWEAKDFEEDKQGDFEQLCSLSNSPELGSTGSFSKGQECSRLGALDYTCSQSYGDASVTYVFYPPYTEDLAKQICSSASSALR